MPEVYERLGAQDAAFLDLETPNHPMHIAAVAIFETSGLRTADGGVDVERIREYVGSRLHRLPRYRQRLARIPLENHPVWVDDPHFNLAYHVRHTALPQPGDEGHLKALTGRIHSQPLDRERPLWEFWVVEGLDEGERFAVIQKTHHCMIDGVSAVDLMATLLEAAPQSDIPPFPIWKPRPAPAGLEMLAEEFGRRLGDVLQAAGEAPALLRDPGAWFERVRDGAQALAETLSAGLSNASETPINRPLGPHRCFEGMALELDRVRHVKSELGGTVNDVVLATVAGALRRFLALRRIDVDSLDIRANVPVSLRSRDERGTLGNRIALLMAELPVDEPDARERLARVRETMGRLKESRQAMGAEVLAAVSEWTSATLLSLAVRTAARGRPYNLVVTNVPGPQVPLHLLEARLLAVHPVVNLLPNQGLGVALFSYAGTLFFGFTGDQDQVPDLNVFVQAIRESFEELEALAGPLKEPLAPAAGAVRPD